MTPLSKAVLTELKTAHALLPNVGPRGSRVFRLAQVQWAGFTG
jgi:hypothetical protein